MHAPDVILAQWRFALTTLHIGLYVFSGYDLGGNYTFGSNIWQMDVSKTLMVSINLLIKSYCVIE